MNPQNHILNLFLGLIAVLVVSSAIAFILKAKFGAENKTIANLTSRINAWWAMILVIFAFTYMGKNAVIFLFLLVSFAALREFLSLIYIRRGDHIALVACFYVILPVQYIFIYTGWYAMAMIFIPVYGFLFLPILAAICGDAAYFLERSTKIQWALMICVFCISHIPALLLLDLEQGNSMELMLFLILVVQSSDVLQYVWGKLFGKRKIAPSISPSKTVVGFAGGVLSASALAACLHHLTPFGAAGAFFIGLAVCMMGFLGGLVMSAIKRDLGVKDWGYMISGHGGMLDRMDSLCFAAPIFFHIVRYFYA